MQVLEGGGDRVSTEGGEVTLNLNAMIEEVADRIGIGDQVAGKIPADAGRIVILRSDQLDTAQSGFQLLKTLAWVLPLLTLAAFGLAVWLARERRRAVRGIGITLAIVGMIGLLAANLTRNYVVDSLVASQDDREAANNAWNILTDIMRGSFRLMVVVGILFVIAAWLAGPGRRALTVRGWLAPGAPESRRGRYVVLAIVTLFLLVISTVDRLQPASRRRDHRRARRDLDRVDASTDSDEFPDAAGLDDRRRHTRPHVGLVGESTCRVGRTRVGRCTGRRRRHRTARDPRRPARKGRS